MSNRNILVVVTSTGCGSCDKFKEEIWPQFQRTLQSGNIDVVHCNLPNTAASLNDKDTVVQWIKGQPRKLHPNLGKLAQWYPTFLLIDETTFETNPQGKVYGGVIDNGQAKLVGGQRITSDLLYKWATQ